MELSRIVRDSASSFDLSSENGYHIPLLGLLFGVPGYEDPQSNRESGYGRYDIQLKPALSGPLSVAFTAQARRPLVTIEVKYLARQDAPQDDAALAEKLAGLAGAALEQIAEHGYNDAPLPAGVCGRLRWGFAFAGKHLAVACREG